MIRFSLICDQGHGFESWFRDNASFDAQVARGLVACPYCGSTRVNKAIMAPAVARTDRDRGAQGETAQTVQAGAQAETAMAALSPQDRALREMIRAFRQHIQANADNVGARFAEEARRMHYGEIAHRSIYGTATPEEVKALHEEGVEAHPLPKLADDLN